MSIDIATMGMFKDCCGRAVGGGGAPPYRQYDEHITPVVFVKSVETKDINITEISKKIKVTLVDEVED